jgi:dipeptidyl-peptidase-3
MAKHIKSESRVQNLEYAEPWKALNDQEKNYAYYMSKASWAGCLVALNQVCYEQVPIFCILQTYFRSKDFDELKEAALATGATEEDWTNFMAYVGGFYGNLSNYHSFGHMKFVPDVSQDVFRAILTSNPEYSEEGSLFKTTFDRLY